MAAVGTTGPSGNEAGVEHSLAEGADREIYAPNQRMFGGRGAMAIAALCVIYTGFHIGVMNLYPLETWTYRLLHVGGGLALGFLLFSPVIFGDQTGGARKRSFPELALLVVASVGVLYGGLMTVLIWVTTGVNTDVIPPAFTTTTFGQPLLVGTAAAIVAAWFFPERMRGRIAIADILLAIASIAVALYIIFHAPILRLRAGTSLATQGDMYAALVGVILILEITRRLAGLALVVIASIFVLYSFVGPYMPGILTHRGYSMERFFTYVYTDQGILGPTTAISSTYIILFITFAAFLQASRVGEYFINFAFATAGGARGGPAKVAVFASGLMGMINGTSAGNVVSTGSLTIPLMKKSDIARKRPPR